MPIIILIIKLFLINLFSFLIIFNFKFYKIHLGFLFLSLLKILEIIKFPKVLRVIDKLKRNIQNSITNNLFLINNFPTISDCFKNKFGKYLLCKI